MKTIDSHYNSVLFLGLKQHFENNCWFIPRNLYLEIESIIDDYKSYSYNNLHTLVLLIERIATVAEKINRDDELKHLQHIRILKQGLYNLATEIQDYLDSKEKENE